MNEANSKNVSKVQTSNNTELLTYNLTQASTTQGIALTDDDAYAIATSSGVSGSNSVARITLSTAGVIDYIANYPASRSARFVAITPPLPSRGNNRYAYVTAGTQYVEVVNVGTATWDQEVSLPASVSSYGVAIGNSGGEAWVADFANPKVYVISTSTNTLLATISLDSTFAPRHIAYNYVSPSEFVMYVTDGTSGNRRVAAIDNTVVSGQVTNRTVSYVVWPNEQPLQLMHTYGIAVNSNVTNRTSVTAYVTWPGDGTRLFFIDISGGNRPGYVYYGQNPIFSTPRGVAWIADGRAYVANQTATKLTTIESNQNHNPSNDVPFNSGGMPYWVTVTTGTYTASPSAPSPQTRLY